MTLIELVNRLHEMEKQGYGHKQVYTTDLSSGVESPVYSARVHEVVKSDFLAQNDELAVGTTYISISIGH